MLRRGVLLFGFVVAALSGVLSAAAAQAATIDLTYAGPSSANAAKAEAVDFDRALHPSVTPPGAVWDGILWPGFIFRALPGGGETALRSIHTQPTPRVAVSQADTDHATPVRADGSADRAAQPDGLPLPSTALMMATAVAALLGFAWARLQPSPSQ